MKKRTCIFLAGLATLGGIVYCSNLLAAQQPAPYVPPAISAPSAPSSKFAVINLQTIVRNYSKYKQCQLALNASSASYRTRGETLTKQMTEAQKEMNNPAADPKVRETNAYTVKTCQRQLEDLQAEVQQKLSKQSFDDMTMIYKDVQAMVTTYATARGIQCVMHYQDAQGAEAFLPQPFQKRMQQGACFPMFMAPGIDITEEITKLLNEQTTPTATGPARPQAQPR